MKQSQHICSRRHRPTRHVIALIAAVVAGFTGSCSVGETSVSVSAADYGDRWPYNGFDGGDLHCYPTTNPLTGQDDLQAVTITLGDTEYGLNGTALARFPDPHRFVLRNEFDTYDFKAMAGMDDLMDRGRTLCSI